MERWVGKVALVTGASAGIGAATAVALADAGMRVVAVARRLPLLQALEKQVTGRGRIHPFRCDVGDEADVQKLVQHTVSTFGGVDLLINNAAVLTHGTITNCSSAFSVISPETIKSIFNINVTGAVILTQAVVANMRARGVHGHVIFVNSIAGHYIPQSNVLLPLNLYPATKHAVTAIVEVMRREFSHCNIPIRVSCVSPGAVDTDMIRVTEIPVEEKMLKPEDVTAAILYIISAPPTVNVQDVVIHPTGEKY